jgi:hypothetical protein
MGHSPAATWLVAITTIVVLRKPAYRHLGHWIVSQRIAIVGVLITGGDREHSELRHLLERMLNAFGFPPFPDAFGKTRRQPQLFLHATQQKHGSRPEPDNSWPPSNPTPTFLRQTDARSNGSTVSSLMTAVALLNRSLNRCRNQKHESNGGFPLHPSLISFLDE